MARAKGKPRARGLYSSSPIGTPRAAKYTTGCVGRAANTTGCGTRVAGACLPRVGVAWRATTVGCVWAPGKLPGLPEGVHRASCPVVFRVDRDDHNRLWSRVPRSRPRVSPRGKPLATLGG